jgi:hypothetical protein
MAKKKHLKLLSSKQLGEVGKIKFKYGVPRKEEDDEEENTQPNYYKQASTLRVSLETFSIEQEQKYKQRSVQIEIPINIDYIQINKESLFKINKFLNDYYKMVGLEAVRFFNFGKSGLFEFNLKGRLTRPISYHQIPRNGSNNIAQL